MPRTVLVCCAALTTVGPQPKGIFSESAGADLVRLYRVSFVTFGDKKDLLRDAV